MLFDSKKFVRSVYHAGKGLEFVAKEQNFRIQLVFAIAVAVFALFFKLKTWEMTALSLAITIMLVLEIINSIFERIVDILEPRVHPYAKAVKDMMASAVLVASIETAIVGIVVFWPYLKDVLYYQ